MKNFYFFALCLISFGLFNYTCSKGDDTGDNVGKSNVLNVSVVNGESYDIDSAYMCHSDSYENITEFTILGRAVYNKGNFSMDLQTPGANLLEKIGEILNPEMLTISDPEALISQSFYLFAIKAGIPVGIFFLAAEEVMFLYADEEVQVSGEAIYDEDLEKGIYNLSLVKGWNTVSMKAYEEDGYSVAKFNTEGNSSGLNLYYIVLTP